MDHILNICSYLICSIMFSSYFTIVNYILTVPVTSQQQWQFQPSIKTKRNKYKMKWRYVLMIQLINYLTRFQRNESQITIRTICHHTYSPCPSKGVSVLPFSSTQNTSRVMEILITGDFGKHLISTAGEQCWH